MIQHLLDTYGYAAVLLLVALESMGIPLPGETALLTASAYAATGHLSIVGAIAAAAAGAVLGDAGAYWIGRTGGLALIRRYGTLFRVDGARLERARGFFKRHGGKTVFLGRFVSLFRMLAALLAGVTRMPYGRFSAFNVAGGICWSLLFGSLGYFFGRQLPQVEHAIGQAGALVALLAALLVGLTLAGRWVVRNAAGIRAWVLRLIRRVGSSPFVRGLRKRHPKAWSFAARRFAAGEYLGLHLTVGLLDLALKRVFHRTRPTWDVPLLTARGWSFPSGHAMGSLIAYGMLAYLLVRDAKGRRARVAIVVGAVLLVLLIGLSRMVLGVHYFSDVLGGYAAGVVWLAACITSLEVARRMPQGTPSS